MSSPEQVVGSRNVLASLLDQAPHDTGHYLQSTRSTTVELSAPNKVHSPGVPSAPQ